MSESPLTIDVLPLTDICFLQLLRVSIPLAVLHKPFLTANVQVLHQDAMASQACLFQASSVSFPKIQSLTYDISFDVTLQRRFGLPRVPLPGMSPQISVSGELLTFVPFGRGISIGWIQIG